MVFDPYFFVAEKHSPKSLLGLFGSLVSEQTESSDWCWFVVKKIAFSERYKGKIEDFSQKKGPSLLRFARYLLRFHLASDWLRNNKHSRNFLWC